MKEPLKITGEKFLIIVELPSKCEIPYWRENDSSHTYYTQAKLLNDRKLLDGDIPLFVYTLTEENYNKYKEDNKVEKIEIIEEPTKKLYIAGEEVNLDGGKIKVTYVNGQTEELDMTNEDVYSYGYTMYDRTTGEKTITVIYGGKSDTYKITIRDDIERIEMKKMPNKLVYEYEYEELDLSGGSVNVIFADGSSTEIDLLSNMIQIDDSEFNYEVEGMQAIKVNYLGHTTEFQIEMKKIISITRINTEPFKNTYYVGEQIDFTGGKIKIYYIDNSREDVDFTDDRIKLYLQDDESDFIEFDKETILTEPGTYIIYISVFPNVEWYYSEWTITVKEKSDSRNYVEVPQIINEMIEYTGEEIYAELLGFDEEIMEVSGDIAGKEAGAYTLQISLKDTTKDVWLLNENEELSEKPIILNWYIEPKVTWAYIKSQYEIYVYTGEEIKWDGEIVGFDEEIYTISGDKQKDVGIYEAILNLRDDKNYTWAYEDRNIGEWEITKANPQIEILNKTQIESNIEALNVVITPSVTNGVIEILYSKDNETNYSDVLPTEAGLYKVKVSLSGDKNLHDTEIEDFLLIEKELTSIPIPKTKADKLVYNGQEQCIFEELVENLIEYENAKAKNAGTYIAKAKIKDKENFKWSDGTNEDKTFEYKIEKIDFTATLENNIQTAGKTEAAKVTITPELTNGELKITYGKDGNYSEEYPTKAGNYIVKVEVSGDINIINGEKELDLTVRSKPSSSGSSSKKTYSIKVIQTDGGTIKIDKAKVKKGESVKIKIITEKIYKLENVLIDGVSVGAVEEYELMNVKKNHVITAVFSRIDGNDDEKIENNFVDIKESDWYYDAVNFVTQKELFKGVSENEFGPNTKLTRGMLVTVLYRYAGAVIENEAQFGDVSKESYYSKPIAWAAENGIVNGVGENKFAPNANITREDLVVILYRYAQKMGAGVSVKDSNIISLYDDFNTLSEYAIPAMQWAVEKGIITGRTTSTIVPKGNATRAEVATIIMRFIEN